MVECVPRSVTDGGSWVHCRPVRLFWRPSLAMTQERYRRMWYFKERRIPPLLPPHPSSLAAAVHDCLFSIFTVNPHFWGCSAIRNLPTRWVAAARCSLPVPWMNELRISKIIRWQFSAAVESWYATGRIIARGHPVCCKVLYTCAMS